MIAHPQRFRRHGFSLIEVVVALGIVSFCLLTLMALLPIGVTSSRDTLQRTTAANIAAEIAADLRIPKPAGGTFTTYNPSPRFGLVTTPGAPPNGNFVTLYFGDQDNFSAAAATVAPGPALYRATITFYTGGAPNCSIVRILVTWPALADANAAAFPANFAGAVDVTTIINPTSP